MSQPSRREIVKQLVEMRNEEAYRNNIGQINEKVAILREKLTMGSDKELDDKEEEMYVENEEPLPRNERIEWLCCYTQDDLVNEICNEAEDEKYRDELDKMEYPDLLNYYSYKLETPTF